MGSRFYVRNFVLLGLIASSQLQIPVDIVEDNIDNEIISLFHLIASVKTYIGINCFITFTDKIDLRTSLQQRLMDTFSLPVYTMASDLGPLNHQYLKAENMVIAFFTGLDDPTLEALNDQDFQYGAVLLILIYAAPPHPKPFDGDSIYELFSWCYDRWLDRTILIIRRTNETEMWSFYFLGQLRVVKLDSSDVFLNNIRKDDYKFLLQVVNDPPTIFWYNSSDQADVTGGGNISLSGHIGLMMMNYLRFLNVTTDIITVPGQQTAQYEIFSHLDDRRVDVVANMVDDNSLKFSPVVMDSQLCVLVSNRRTIPVGRYFDQMVSPGVHRLTTLTSIAVFAIKYLSQRHRSILDPFFNTLRFFLALPLPNGSLDRLPMADKFIEVFSFFFVALFVSSNVSLLSTVFTTGIYEPAITNAETMRASGLKILTYDPSIVQAFNDNTLPNSLADQVVLVDFPTMFHLLVTLNDSYAYVVKTPNWQSFRLFQQRMKSETLKIIGGELCSKSRPMRIAINSRSPIRFFFKSYFEMVFESGLQKKWLEMSFQKYRDVTGLKKLPMDASRNSEPLTIDFFTLTIKMYICGMALSALVFVIELLLDRYNH
ncbi:uncharacterized protein LOC108029847 [Drosophila biarmipes]|uniref:uncharacterized protein LOC108029847 n=1 Tax=Drosophila biarmipes TaxID=125945 RepID=UPI0007E7FFA4|nr:uncharacterized protein LOC108029847 [Drosophila biarmipes]